MKSSSLPERREGKAEERPSLGCKDIFVRLRTTIVPLQAYGPCG